MEFKINKGVETVKLTAAELRKLGEACDIAILLRKKASGKLQAIGDRIATGIEDFSTVYVEQIPTAKQ